MSTAGGNTSGFDYLRIILSLAVLTWHCYAVTNFDAANAIFWGGPLRALPAFILPMFFALSGFLVSGSLARSRLHEFALLRILRIVPALAFETILTGVLLGAAFTTLPLAVYFTSPEFFSYFLNIFGYIHYTLPGVFDGRMLNAQLWTIPSEFECYLVLMLAAAAGLTGRRRLFAWAVVIGSVAMTVFSISAGTLNPYAPLGGRVLVFAFLAGVLLYLYKDFVRHDLSLFAACLVAAAGLLTYQQTSYLAALPVAYVTVWLGLTRPPKIKFGDLSYGVFLFHFPILQSLYQSFGGTMPWFMYCAAVVPLSIGIAWISWCIVEQPVLTRKKRIISMASGLLTSHAGISPVRGKALQLDK